MTETVTENLNRVLARTFGLYVQTHGYHWNVAGAEFLQLHSLFEAQYQDLWGALDPLAERIRSLGAHAPGSIAELTALGAEEPAPVNSADAMIDALIDAHENLAADLQTAIHTAQDAGDEPSAGLLADRQGWHQQQLWMMKAIRH